MDPGQALHGGISRPLLVDLYELTMVDAYRRTGMASTKATFSLFVRGLPPGRGYLVAAGLDDALRWLEELRFGDEDLAIVDRLGLFDADFLAWLGELRFTGSVRAVPEGTIVFPGEPMLEVDAPVGEGQLAESYLLNQITLQTMLATKAARCRHAAAGRTVIDFALRRCQGIDAAVKLARVARLVGLDATSNVAAADHYASMTFSVAPHQVVELEYRAPTMAFLKGALGPPPQKYPGATAQIMLLVAVVVIAVLAAVIGAVGAG